MSKSSRRAFLGRLGTAAVVPALGSLSSSAFSFSAPAVASAEQGAAPRASYDLLIAGGWVIRPGAESVRGTRRRDPARSGRPNRRKHPAHAGSQRVRRHGQDRHAGVDRPALPRLRARHAARRQLGSRRNRGGRHDDRRLWDRRGSDVPGLPEVRHRGGAHADLRPTEYLDGGLLHRYRSGAGSRSSSRPAGATSVLWPSGCSTSNRGLGSDARP